MKKFILLSIIVLSIIRSEAQQSVGIGTTMPNASSILELNSTTKGFLLPRMLGSERAGIVAPATGLMVYQTDITLGNGGIGYYIYDGNAWKRMAKSEELGWTLSGSNLYTTIIGSVGIGTSAPNSSAALDISSTTKGLLIPRMNSSQRTDIVSPVQGLMVFQNTGTATLGFWYHDGTTWQRFAKASELTGSDSWTVAGDNQFSNVDGNVGIGVMTPTSKLHLAGNLLLDTGTVTMNNPTGILQFQNTGVNKAFVQLSGNNLRLGTNIGNGSGQFIVRMNGQEHLTIDSTGQVGIGTQTPDSKLHILGHAKMSYPVAAGPVLTMETTYLPVPNMPNTSGIEFRRNGSWAGSLSYYSPNMVPGNPNPVMTSGVLRFSASDPGANDLVVSSSGTVGIGTSSPSSGTKLQITGGAIAGLGQHGHLLIGETTALSLAMDQNSIQARDNGVASRLQLQDYGGGFRVKVSALVVGDDNLNVGLSVLDPTARLHIGGSSPTIQLQDNGDDKGFVQLSGDNIRIGTNSGNTNGQFVIRTNGGDRMFVNSSGNVGIGTSNPLSKLDVAGLVRIDQNGEALRIDGTNPHIEMWHNGTDKFYMQQLGNHFVVSHAVGNPTGRLILGAAEVAINTFSPAPGYSLSVAGEIICEELRVELAPNGPWPDYVFAEDYKLQPLHELKAFVAANKHLPNIPAAAQVESEGFDVGDMNRRLLEKVEQLTLYIIQQQEDIDELKKKHIRPLREKRHQH